MDLTHSDGGRAFRAEVRGWLEEQPHAASSPTSAGSAGRAASTRPTTSGSPGTAISPSTAGPASAGRTEHGGRGLPPDPAGDLPRGVRPCGRARPGQPPGRGAARAHADRVRHRGPAAALPAADRRASASCGARATPSPAPAPTWRTSQTKGRWSRQARPTGSSGWSTARRCGPRSPTSPTGASCSPAPSPGRGATRACRYLLVPMDQDGVEVRPIEQLTGGSEFNEVFFTGATTDADLVVGEPGRGLAGRDGHASASSAASRRSGSSVGFARELDALVDLARRNGTLRRPVGPRPAGERAGSGSR